MVARVPGALGRSLGRPWWLVATVALATMLRAAHVLSLRATPWFDHLVVDPEYYDEWARRIAAGDWLGERPFYMDPLYPYFLGVIYRLWVATSSWSGSCRSPSAPARARSWR